MLYRCSDEILVRIESLALNIPTSGHLIDNKWKYFDLNEKSLYKINRI